MKRIYFLFLSLLLFSCNIPATDSPQSITAETPTFSVPTSTPAFLTFSPTPSLIPPTPTETPIPCDPLNADYCIMAGHFLFQHPIFPPGNDEVDLTYLYATTANGKRDPHHGVEFQNAFGTPVHAAGDGTVVFADSDTATLFSPWADFYGNVVIIRHTNQMYTLYAHLSAILVQPGIEVKAGDVIGQVGATGGATGAHLHFEVREGSDYTDYFSTQNPELWLIPQEGTGAMSITLKTSSEEKRERPLVITRYAAGSDAVLFTYYITSYAKGFEQNAEDAALNSLPAGRYKIAFNDTSGLRERIVEVEAGELTEVVFEVK